MSFSNGLEKCPKLRFPGFDEPWENKNFDQTFTILPNNTLSRADLQSDGVVHDIHYGDVLIKFGSILDMEDEEVPYIAAGKEGKASAQLQDGDIVFADTAEDETAGKVVEIYNAQRKQIEAGLHTIPCRPINAYAPMYLGYYMNSMFYHNQLLSLLQGVKVLSISKANISKTVITSPQSKTEQEKISSFMYLIDLKVKKQLQVIDTLKKYKRGVTAKLIAAIEEKYPVVKLGEYVTVMRGSSPRPIDAYLTNSEEGVRWIKIGDTQPDKLYITETKERIKPEGVKKSRRVYEGDLILSNSMSFGRPYILKVDGCIHDGWLLIRDKKHKFDKRFLCFYLASDSTLTQYKKYAAGSCVNNLNSELVASVEIGMPPIDQQIHVADILEKVDRQVQALSTMYSLLNRVRSALLQQLFI